MRRGLALAAVCAAAAAVAAAPAGATNECHGLKQCVPVVGPWVLATGGGEVEYQLACPLNFVVGGLDAELSTAGIEVRFYGALGAPVNPGVTTSTSAIFLGQLVRGTDAAATFRPHIGCIPPGGGQRVPTGVRVYRPAKPTAPVATQILVRPGTERRVERCAAGQRLAAASHAIAFLTKAPPGLELTRNVHVTQTVSGGSVRLLIRAGARVLPGIAVVQADLLCVRRS
jgi:hypothetical protein